MRKKKNLTRRQRKEISYKENRINEMDKPMQYSCVRDENENIHGLWLQNSNKIRDLKELSVLLIHVGAPRELSIAAFMGDFRVVPNLSDGRGGVFVMFGSAPAPGEDAVDFIKKNRAIPPWFGKSANNIRGHRSVLNNKSVYSVAFWLFPIIGLPLALMAINEIKNSGGEQYGLLLARMSLVINSILVAMGILGMALGIYQSY